MIGLECRLIGGQKSCAVTQPSHCIVCHTYGKAKVKWTRTTRTLSALTNPFFMTEAVLANLSSFRRYSPGLFFFVPSFLSTRLVTTQVQTYCSSKVLQPHAPYHMLPTSPPSSRSQLSSQFLLRNLTLTLTDRLLFQQNNKTFQRHPIAPLEGQPYRSGGAPKTQE